MLLRIGEFGCRGPREDGDVTGGIRKNHSSLEKLNENRQRLQRRLCW